MILLLQETLSVEHVHLNTCNCIHCWDDILDDDDDYNDDDDDDDDDDHDDHDDLDDHDDNDTYIIWSSTTETSMWMKNP